eukprot:UN08169
MMETMLLNSDNLKTLAPKSKLSNLIIKIVQKKVRNLLEGAGDLQPKSTLSS